MSDLLKKATKYAESIKADDAYHISKAEFENYAKTDFQAGYICCQQEYEEKLRWIPVEEKIPEKQGHYLVIAPKSFPKNCKVVVAEFYEDNNTFYSESSDCPIEDATHWRPIDFL